MKDGSGAAAGDAAAWSMSSTIPYSPRIKLRAEKASVEEKNKEAKRRAIQHGYSDPAVQTMSIKAVRR